MPEAAAFRPGHISEYPTKPGPQIKAAMAKPVFAMRKHFEEADFKNRGQAAAKNQDIREHTERRDALEVAKGARRRDYERMGFPVVIDDKGNKTNAEILGAELGLSGDDLAALTLEKVI